MSMSPEIMKRYIRLPTARDIWKALSKAFYDGSDELQVFVLSQRAFSAKQSGRTLSAYYGELTEIFGELDHRDKVIMESENDVESYRKSVQRQRVHIFLAGLDGEFEQVHAEILRKDPIPELEACHALIRRESVRRTNMVEESERTEASAMVTRYRPSQNQPKPTNAADKSTYKCTHCNQNGHTKNRCYELMGYPEWWDHNHDRQKRNFKRTSSTAVVETKTEDDVTGQHSALAAAAGNGGKALNMSTLVTNSAWIIDSDATDHMTFDSRQVSTLKQSSQKFVTTANGTLAPIIREGHLPLTDNMNLDSVLVVPSLDYNLLFVSQITTALFCVVIFWPNFCVFKDIRTRQTIGYGVRRGKLYYLDLVSKSSDKLCQALMVNDSEGEMRKSNIWLWHRRLGHASFSYLKKLFPSLFTKCDVSSFQCEVCELAKSHRVSFPLALNKSPDPFMIIHSDVWGPSKVNSLGGSRWFVTFIDDCTRMTWVQLMKSKSEVNVLFQQFCKMIHTQYNARIQVLRSDNGGEYLSAELQQYLKAHGIIHQTTCSNTPQQNGVAERKNRHLLEVVRASLIEAHLPLSYWGEALISAAYLINRVPSRTIDYQTPSQALVEAIVAPVLPNLPPHVFCCVAFVHLHKHQRNKLSPRALRCVFVGYATHQKGYRCYHPPTRKMFITLDVVFHEDLMYFSTESELQGEHQKEIQTLDYDDELAENVDVHISEDTQISEDAGNLDISEDELSEPVNQVGKFVEESSQEHAETEVVTPSQSEFDTPHATDTPHQSLAEDAPEPHRKQLPQRLTRGIPKPTYEPELCSKVKYPMSHFVSNHRLSESNRSFVNQLSTVSIPNNVHEALADPRWKEAMNEEMKSLQENKTWEAIDRPSGKKPVGCRWIYTVKYKADGTIERFKARLVAKGYTQTYGIDYTETFAPVAKINTVRVLLSLAANLNWPLQQFDVKNAFLHGELSEEVYMELSPGCMMPKTDSQKVCKLQKALYGLKQSPRAWFGRFTKSMRAFGYHQSNSDHTLFLKKKQGKITALIVYVDDMVVTGNDPEEREALQGHLSREFKMKDLGPLKYFLGIEVSRSKKGIFLSQRKYALDLLRETGMLACQPVDTLVEEGLKLRIESNQVPVDKGRYQRLVGRLMYLAHTRPDLAYALRGNLVIWRSKKQNVVARSSAEAEFRGIALRVCEALWLRLLLQDLGCVSKQPIKLYCYNKAACDIAHNPVQHDRTKHVEIDRFFIKEKLDEKIVELPHIRSEDQLADILTKAVSSFK
ncbi:hypothetical protein RJ639_010144 [Escallonia herrerae]|uniref:Integrase catalytic domain-containing protein n=1 Tax=Escallonia herrerae TaxID=1293975 RepID=A0AA89AST0_9ASTE|nr:hypothetical protein RJ639_010144 [Escallonia herrerae]